MTGRKWEFQTNVEVGGVACDTSRLQQAAKTKEEHSEVFFRVESR